MIKRLFGGNPSRFPPSDENMSRLCLNTDQTRRFTTNHGLYFVVIGLLVVVIVLCDRSTPIGIATCAVALRVLGMLVVAGFVGLFTGSFRKCLLGTLLGVLVADVGWLAFHLANGFRIDAESLPYNWLLVIGLFVCASATAQDRISALALGCSFSILLPLAIFIWMLPSVRKTGLGAILLLFATFTGITTGCIGTIITRLLFELAERRHTPNAPSKTGTHI